MKKSLKFGLLYGFLLAVLCSCYAQAESTKLKPPIVRSDQHFTDGLQLPYLQMNNYAADLSVGHNTTMHYFGHPPGIKVFAEHVEELRITETSSYGPVRYNIWSPRTGSYYYLLGNSSNPASGWRL